MLFGSDPQETLDKARRARQAGFQMVNVSHAKTWAWLGWATASGGVVSRSWLPTPTVTHPAGVRDLLRQPGNNQVHLMRTSGCRKKLSVD